MKRRLKALLLAGILLFSTHAMAQELSMQEIIAQTLPALTSLAAVHVGAGMDSPQDEISDQYARFYLFFRANLEGAPAGALDPDPEQESGPYGNYRFLSSQEADEWLFTAFGGLYECEDLTADDSMLLETQGGFLIGLSDGYPFSVNPATEEDEPFREEKSYPFEWILEEGELPRQGNFTASFEIDEESGSVFVSELEFSGEDETLLCNWISASGAWFSLMEEGFVFVFDEDSDLIGNGSWALNGDTLSFDFGDDRADGTYEGESISIALPGRDEEVFIREVFS